MDTIEKRETRPYPYMEQYGMCHTLKGVDALCGACERDALKTDNEMLRRYGDSESGEALRLGKKVARLRAALVMIIDHSCTTGIDARHMKQIAANAIEEVKGK